MAGKNAEYNSNFTAFQGFNLIFSAPSFIALCVFLLVCSWPQNISSSVYNSTVVTCFLGIYLTVPSTSVFVSHKILQKPDRPQMLFLIVPA